MSPSGALALDRALAVFGALALDAAFGEPPDRLHPVAWIGAWIERGRSWALQGGRATQLARGAVVALVVPATAALIVHAIARAAAPSALASAAVGAVLLKPTFAVRALGEAALRVRDALEAGDLAAARRALGSLCSRDPRGLDGGELAAAAIESVAENTSDSVVAPLAYFAAFGLPGAAFYRAANTIDAMMGYHGELEWAGKAGARLDDLLNLVPARLTALLLVCAGAVLGEDARRGLAVWRRDGGKTESPNAGRPMAAMAGVLGLRLAKRGAYALGDDVDRPVGSTDIARAWRVARLASMGAALLAASFPGAVACLRGAGG
ncbi:MAG: cobalamin biosynthesis protein CobD [Myxococcales bacterium]|nr:cobalamin biosynthesis protein CobD [Myxococcales bacterium]